MPIEADDEDDARELLTDILEKFDVKQNGNVLGIDEVMALSSDDFVAYCTFGEDGGSIELKSTDDSYQMNRYPTFAAFSKETYPMASDVIIGYISTSILRVPLI